MQCKVSISCSPLWLSQGAVGAKKKKNWKQIPKHVYTYVANNYDYDYYIRQLKVTWQFLLLFVLFCCYLPSMIIMDMMTIKFDEKKRLCATKWYWIILCGITSKDIMPGMCSHEWVESSWIFFVVVIPPSKWKKDASPSVISISLKRCAKTYNHVNISFEAVICSCSRDPRGR